MATETVSRQTYNSLEAKCTQLEKDVRYLTELASAAKRYIDFCRNYPHATKKEINYIYDQYENKLNEKAQGQT